MDPVGKRCVEEDAGKSERVLLVSSKPAGSVHSRSGQSPSFRTWAFPVMDERWQGAGMKVTTLSKWLLTAVAALSHSGLWTPRTALSGFPRENPVKLLPLPFSSVSLLGRTPWAWGESVLHFCLWKLFEIPCHEKTVSFVFLFNDSSMHARMELWVFILHPGL